jgi:hypothetical protein
MPRSRKVYAPWQPVVWLGVGRAGRPRNEWERSLRLDGVFRGPLARSRLVLRPVRLVHMRNLGHERVVGVRVRQHRADGKKDYSAG